MASYSLEWKRSAKKELRSLPKDAIERIVTAATELSTEPLPPGVRKLVGSEHIYRIRVGDYRIVYELASARRTIEIIRIRHRKDVYDR